MSVNKEKPHVLVLPEDDANRQIAIGFQLALDWTVHRRMQVLPPAGGWNRVLDAFESDHIGAMERNPNRNLILLIDFDRNLTRIADARQRIPSNLFVLGALSRPEDLRSQGLGLFEQIGENLAQDCREGTQRTWRHELLQHNAPELVRLEEHVRPILFPNAGVG